MSFFGEGGLECVMGVGHEEGVPSYAMQKIKAHDIKVLCKALDIKICPTMDFCLVEVRKVAHMIKPARVLPLL